MSHTHTYIHYDHAIRQGSLRQTSKRVPSLSVGPGFLSTSPAIRSRDSTTAHTRGRKHTQLSTPTIPLASLLGTDPPPNLGHRTLPHPLLPFGQPPHLRNTYSSISDRETTAMQPWSTRGVLFTTSPTPHLAALHWTGSGR